MKAKSVHLCVLPLLVGVLVTFACSSTSGTNDDPDASGPAATDPVVSADECGDACKTKAAECGAPASAAAGQCSAICGKSPTKSQLACLSGKSCSELARLESSADFDEACKKPASTTPSPTSTPTTPAKDSGPAACIALGKGGCSSLNAPSGCCTDSAHPSVVCSGNNDGKGNAQCCVNLGKPCTDVTDCCGYAGASTELKKLYRCDGTCKSG